MPGPEKCVETGTDVLETCHSNGRESQDPNRQRYVCKLIRAKKEKYRRLCEHRRDNCGTYSTIALPARFHSDTHLSSLNLGPSVVLFHPVWSVPRKISSI